MVKAWMLAAAALTMAATGAAAKPAKQSMAERGEAELAKAVRGLVPGKPERCISYSAIRATQVIPGVGLLYDMGGGRKYLNRPKSGANWLRWDVIPVTTIFGGQLCGIDTVKLVDRGTRMQSGFVILEDFVPYTKPGKVR